MTTSEQGKRGGSGMSLQTKTNRGHLAYVLTSFGENVSLDVDGRWDRMGLRGLRGHLTKHDVKEHLGIDLGAHPSCCFPDGSSGPLAGRMLRGNCWLR